MQALGALTKALFVDRNNLIGTDFDEISSETVEHEFAQDSSGERVTFIVSHHALGKIREVPDLEVLRKRERDRKTWKYVVQSEPHRPGDPWPPNMTVIADRHDQSDTNLMKFWLGDELVGEASFVARWSRKEMSDPYAMA